MDIPAKAKKCAYCHQYQTWGSMIILNPASLVAMVCSVFLTAFYGMNRLFDQGELYSYSDDQILVLESAISFGQTQKSGPTVAVLGTVTNTTPTPWSRVRFHVRFTGADGRTIDAGQQQQWDLVLPPHAVIVFKLSFPREFDPSNYLSHSVQVIGAADARARF